MNNTLLLVDDDNNIIRSLKRLLRNEDYKILIAHSGEEALHVLEQEPVSVILSDQRMPAMTGAELFKVVKERFPDTLRIILSGYTELESIASAINDGAIFKLLFKPWDDQQLLKEVRGAFSIQQMKAHNRQLMDDLRALNADLERRVEEKTQAYIISSRALQVSQEILECSPFAMLGISDENNIVMANAAGRALIGDKTVIGRAAVDVLPKPIFEEYKKLEMHSDNLTQRSLQFQSASQQYNIVLSNFNNQNGVRGAVIVGVIQNKMENN